MATTKAPTTKKSTPMKPSAEAQAAELKISAVGDFKKRLGGVFELPSGLTVRLRNPGGLSMFLTSGSIPNSLMSIVRESMKKSSAADSDGVEDKELTASDYEKLIDDDPQALESMNTMLDNLAIRCMVQPQCHPVPVTESDRQDHLLYADEVDMKDKQWMLTWITSGVTDLAPFRKESK